MIDFNAYDFKLIQNWEIKQYFKAVRPTNSSCISDLLERNTRSLKKFLEDSILFNNIFEEMGEEYLIKTDLLLRIIFKNQFNFKRVTKYIMKKPELFIWKNDEDNSRKNSKTDIKDRIFLNCGHSLNKSKTITKLKEMTKYENIKCEDEECDNVLTYKDLNSKVIGKELIDHFMSLLSDFYLKTNRNGIFRCINYKCSNLLSHTVTTNFITCECGAEVCTCCKLAKHNDITCIQVKIASFYLREAEKSINAFAYFLDLQNLARKTIQCPECKARIFTTPYWASALCTICNLSVCIFCEEISGTPCISREEYVQKQRNKEIVINIAKKMYEYRNQVTP